MRRRNFTSSARRLAINTDYVIFFVAALLVVIGAGLFRVGLMNLKVGSPEETRRARLFIALGIAFGIAAVLVIMLRAVKIGG
jgi:hypothetical protein